jgi:hypothetical protein
MSQSPHELDLLTIGVGRCVLDHQLVEVDGMRCGKADDVAIAPAPGGGPLELAGVLTGPGALLHRYRKPVMRYVIGLAGRDERFVAWEDIADVESHLQLARRGVELDLASAERRAAAVLDRIQAGRLHPDHSQHLDEDASRGARAAGLPDGAVRLSHVLGQPLVDGAGRRLGTVRELVARRSGRLLGEAAGYAWEVTHLEVGAAAVAARLGLPHRAAVRYEARRIEGWGGPLRFT